MVSLSSSRSHNRYHVRSISFPGRSHPSTIKIEQVLNKIKTWEASSSSSKAEKVYKVLPGLVELYECIEELLALPITQRDLLQHHQHENLVNELLERSVRFIDICSNARETVMMSKEAIRELQSALRRSKAGDHLNIESGVAAYACSRRKIQKEIEKSLAMLKQIESCRMVSNSDSLIVGVLTEASLVSISTFQSLLLFLSVPILKPKPSRWSLVSKLVQKGALLANDQAKRDSLSDLEKVDIALNDLLLNNHGKQEEAEKLELAQSRLETLDTSNEILENGLEHLFKHLIRTRVSLLNNLSD
ncbi:PREDICTED: uncharacterized protein LOC109167538 [Ipomoea nil]|uniref:uncharacterized protein LOC109167538 n=1 Tax=Ipomoea nil TaxID=35883 RepID=UPI00090145B7|nr:PREDICTED: uncharacterized protein LOC109167538 [Ipomoea nil]